MKKKSLKKNTFAYLVSMRWCYSPIAVMTGWLGISFAGTHPNNLRQILVLAVLSFGWGANQIINDYLGLAEDKLNAPNRPMTSGKLNIKFALTLSLIIFFLGFILTYRLNPEALIFYLAAFILNLGYARAKRMPLVGNIIFGLLITCCLYYAPMGVYRIKLLDLMVNGRLAALAILIWLINFTLCFFTDFKDFQGDKKTKIKTLVVLLSPQRAKYLGLILIIIPFFCLTLFLKYSLLPQPGIIFSPLLILTFLTFLYPALLLIKNPAKLNSRRCLKWFVMGIVLFESALMGLITPGLSAILFILNFIGITGLFKLYKDYPI